MDRAEQLRKLMKSGSAIGVRSENGSSTQLKGPEKLKYLKMIKEREKAKEEAEAKALMANRPQQQPSSGAIRAPIDSSTVEIKPSRVIGLANLTAQPTKHISNPTSFIPAKIHAADVGGGLSSLIGVYDDDDDDNDGGDEKNDSDINSNSLPTDFFDVPQVQEQQKQEKQQQQQQQYLEESSSLLPAGFFDDPAVDRKVRGIASNRQQPSVKQLVNIHAKVNACNSIC